MSRIPYVVGQWVRGERFYGRERLIAEVLEGPRNGLWVLGTRRIGKTSLLKQLEHLTADGRRGYLPLFWDFQGADDPDELRVGFHDALLDAEDRLAALGIDPAELESDDLFAAMSQLRRRLRSSEKTLLLLCDEVEELIQLGAKEPSLLRKLRRALLSQEGVRAILASSIRLWALAGERADTSPFLHGFTPPLYIASLETAEARQLIVQTHLPAASRPGFDAAAVERLAGRCDGHPYLLQLVCKRSIELGDLDEAFEHVASDPMVRHFFAVDFDLASDLEQRVLRHVATAAGTSSQSLRDRLGSGSGSVSEAVQRLEGLGFLHRDAERRFRLSNPFFETWLRELDAASSPSATLTETAGPESAAGLFADRYRLLDEVGRGAGGVVFKALDTALQTTVALKLLKAEAGSAIDRFRREILLARDLAHPNVVRVYDLGRSAGRAYLTMQWIEGPTLAEAIAGEAPFEWPRAAGIAAKLASALAAAHRANVLHRDLKPRNVLLDPQGEPVLGDFGLARLIGEPGLTAEGLFVGTPYYASPEQAEMRPLDGRSDLYALGLVLFEMLTGRRAFEGESSAEVLERQRLAPPPDPRDLVPQVPPELAAVVLRCLEKDPERRFATGEELERALRGLLSV